MGVPALLDHVVLAGPDLAEAIAAVERATGVRASPGGAHPTGTANALIAFTRRGERVRQYLEVIGPDAAAGRSASEISTFGLDRLSAPAVASWAIRPDDLDATVARARTAGVGLRGIEPLSRRTPDGGELAWRLARPEDERRPPFLIDWGATAHPGLADVPLLELVALRRRTTDVESETHRLRALGVAVGSGDDELELVPAATDGFEVEIAVDGRSVVLR